MLCTSITASRSSRRIQRVTACIRFNVEEADGRINLLASKCRTSSTLAGVARVLPYR